ncbi:hypothetical protein MJO29_009168 [Puccinia striiformis f. sp. tritici]|nr:hypothetical protein MJO29_009168 [Puccinia striiformis f. sp. tritici]
MLVTYYSILVFTTSPIRIEATPTNKNLVLRSISSIQSNTFYILTTIMSCETSQNADPSSSNNDQPNEERLLITNTPAEDSTNEDTRSRSIDVGGESVQLDHLGPMVINTDGTISRISNWDKLTEPERTRTIRLVTKRNAQRIQHLKQNDQSLTSSQADHQSNLNESTTTTSTHTEL